MGGTCKSSAHVPGYSGHIPTSRLNERAFQHGLAKEPRSSKYPAHLRRVYKPIAGGYTGHMPKDPHNNRGVPTATFETTASRADRAVLSMLEARGWDSGMNTKK